MSVLRNSKQLWWVIPALSAVILTGYGLTAAKRATAMTGKPFTVGKLEVKLELQPGWEVDQGLFGLDTSLSGPWNPETASRPVIALHDLGEWGDQLPEDMTAYQEIKDEDGRSIAEASEDEYVALMTEQLEEVGYSEVDVDAHEKLPTPDGALSCSKMSFYEDIPTDVPHDEIREIHCKRACKGRLLDVAATYRGDETYFESEIKNIMKSVSCS